VRRLNGDVRVPAKSTIHAVLDRHGLVKRARRRRNRAEGTPLSEGTAPNDLWCADFKGEFKLGNGRYCYPLTVTDQASRYLLMCEALESVREELAFTASRIRGEVRFLGDRAELDATAAAGDGRITAYGGMSFVPSLLGPAALSIEAERVPIAYPEGFRGRATGGLLVEGCIDWRKYRLG